MEEISVSNLRKLYSSLLEELAPLHHELGTGNNNSDNNNSDSHNNTTALSNANFRWKNTGTITVNGTDDMGYDYSYTPDDYDTTKKLGGKGVVKLSDGLKQQMMIGRNKATTTTTTMLLGGGGGIMGGDWSRDGVRRYHTGGVTTTSVMRDAVQKVEKDTKVNDIVEEQQFKSNEVILLDSLHLDERFAIQEDDDDNNEGEKGEENDDEMLFDVAILTPVPSTDVEEYDDDHHHHHDKDYDEAAVVLSSDQAPSSSSSSTSFIADRTTLSVHTNDGSSSSSSNNNNNNNSTKKKATTTTKQTAATIMKSSSSINASSSINSPAPPPMSTFESLIKSTTTTATTWHLRSAYSPTTPYEQQLLQSLGSSGTTTTSGSRISSAGNNNKNNNNNNNNNNKVHTIMSGHNTAQNSEVRVCHSLKRITEILCVSERRKGRQLFADMVAASSSKSSYRNNNKKKNSVMVDTPVMMKGEDEDDEEELEVSEAVFAYFCEKNVLPLLVDSFLTRPTPITWMDEKKNDNDSDEEEDDEEEWWNKDKKKDIISSSSPPPPSLFSGVSWTASVKSQILQTISMLLLNTTSPLSLTFLLSNNYMNELIMGMLPLSQWREEALDEMLPPFVTLLRGLVMKLRGDEGRGLIPLLLCQRPSSSSSKSGGGGGDDKEGTSETYLPLLYAAVQVFCYSPGSSLRDVDGCMVRTTAMNAILNLCRVTSPDVRAVLVGEAFTDESLLPCGTKSSFPFNNLSSMLLSSSSSSSLASPLHLAPAASSFPNATIEQQVLFPYICSNLKTCYHRCVRLMMTSIAMDKSSEHNQEAKAEATQRHVDLAASQFSELQYWFGFLDDLLSCEIRVWNVRLVEWIMREVVVGTVLLHWNRALRVIVETTTSDHGSSDAGSKAAKKDSLEHCKAKSEIRVSIVFLTQLFAMVSYRPLIRLVGAALLHPKYPLAWCGDDDNLFGSFADGGNDFFQVTPLINAIVSNEERDSDGGDKAATTGGGEEADAGAGVKDDAFVPSPHRASLLEMLAGDEAIIASMLLGTILENDELDDKALDKLGVLPSPNDDAQVSPFEEALAKFLSSNTEENPDAKDRRLTTSPRNYKRSASGAEAGGNQRTNETLSVAVEFVSSLGLMLMERIIFHTWTEGGECLDVVPFDHYYKSSKFLQALNSSLMYFASFTKRLAGDDYSLEEYFHAEFNRRYVPTEANNDSFHSGRSRTYYENNIKMASCIQNYRPSNFIDDANVLLQSSGPTSTESAEDKAAKCAIRLTLHLVRQTKIVFLFLLPHLRVRLIFSFSFVIFAAFTCWMRRRILLSLYCYGRASSNYEQVLVRRSRRVVLLYDRGSR